MGMYGKANESILACKFRCVLFILTVKRIRHITIIASGYWLHKRKLFFLTFGHAAFIFFTAL